MRSLFTIMLFFSILLSKDYQVENSKVTYYGDHYFHKWEGSTGDIRGDVQYDENKKQYNCSVVIPISTFSSGNDSRDSNMLIYCKAFDFPNITFCSSIFCKRFQHAVLDIPTRRESSRSDKSAFSCICVINFILTSSILKNPSKVNIVL